MIDTKKLLRYIQSQGKNSTIKEIDKLIEGYDRESVIKSEKNRFRYEIWDKKTPINNVSAETILKNKGYKISNAYLIYIDNILVYFQDHNPTVSGYEAMTKKDAEKMAINFINKKVEENVDNLIASYVINKISFNK